MCQLEFFYEETLPFIKALVALKYSLYRGGRIVFGIMISFY